MPKQLLFPDDVRQLLRRRYELQWSSWLGAGRWPLRISLGDPTERFVTDDATLVRSWVEAWSTWSERGHVEWEERRWPRLGAQRVPVRIRLDSATDVAAVIGQSESWARAHARHGALLSSWPQLAAAAISTRIAGVLADYSDEDFDRLITLVRWLEANPDANCYIRQLPVPGVDTKWIDAKRRGMIVDLLRDVRALDGAFDFHQLCGVRRPPHRIRMRVLCSHLRAALGGLGDIEAPLEELARLDLHPERLLIVENLETGIALPELAGTVAFMKLGTSVSVLGSLPWLNVAQIVYWGDIDTHGFAILDHARATFPQLRSVLMDEETLLANRELWGREPAQYGDAELRYLMASELCVYERLRTDFWGRSIRLEQERIPWLGAVDVLRGAFEGWR